MPQIMCLSRFLNKNALILLLLTSLFSLPSSLSANGGEGHGAPAEEKFNVKEATFHHLLDNYDWEFYKREDGTAVKISLPRILFHNGQLKFFGSTEEALATGNYQDAHHVNPEAKHGDLLVGTHADIEKLEELKHEAEKSTGEAKKEATAAYKAKLAEMTPMDFSFTKNVLYMMFASILLLVVFTSVAKAYRRRQGKAPKGLQSAMESIVVFVRDEIAKENIGHHKYEKFMPLLLTLFFFILFLNLLGMTPFSANVTGNISVTLALSIVTLIAVNFSANKAYWKHILWPPVPHGVKVIMVPLEIISIFTKPFALTIRLFANISGGHIIMVSLMSLIFIFGDSGRQAAMGWGVGIFSSLFIVAISLLELFVAFLQAYVFTMLTAVFIGQAVADEEHH